MLDRRQTLGHSSLNGLVGCWPLDDARNINSNTTQRELHQGLRLSVSNNPQDAQGVYGGQASQFDIVDSRCLFRASQAELNVGTSDATWIVWVYHDAFATTQCLFSKYQSTGNQVSFALQTLTTPRFRFGASPDGTAAAFATVTANTFGAPSTATWYMVTAQHINGATIGISVNAGTMDTTAYTGGIFSSTARFDVSSILEGTAQYVGGRMMRLIFAKRAFSQEEIAWHYNGGIGRRYPFV